MWKHSSILEFKSICRNATKTPSVCPNQRKILIGGTPGSGKCNWLDFEEEKISAHDTVCHSCLGEIRFHIRMSICYMDLSKLLDGFVKVDVWISLSCYMDLSKLIHGFIDFFTFIRKSCFMDLSELCYVFPAHCQIKSSWSLTKTSRLVEAFAMN